MTPAAGDFVHISNGDAVAELLRRFGLPGDIVPWRDSLHMGPAVAGGEAA